MPDAPPVAAAEVDEPEEPVPPEPTPADEDEKPPSLEDVVARALPAVASIYAGGARGSGFFVRPDIVVTNAHVVVGQTSVRLQVGDRMLSARVATISPGTDLALLKVEGANPAQPTLPLGSSSKARVGQEVLAIGSALGVLSNTVTRGIVSAVRQVGAVTLVQTDAAINPGNSGGPLLDRHGVVIGVNSMTVARQSGEGVAFAVAIDHAVHLIDKGPGVDTTRTPLSGLEQMFEKPAEPEDERTRGEHEYARAVETTARSADQIDELWDRYAASCVARAASRGARPWFSVYEPGGVSIHATSAYDCRRWLETVSMNAAAIRTRMEQATLAARRAGVFPGTGRDLRRRFRMNWPGFE